MMKVLFPAALLFLFFVATAQQKVTKKGAPSGPPALAAIKEADLKRDLYAMASDHFRGREAGTLDELKVSV